MGNNIIKKGGICKKDSNGVVFKKDVNKDVYFIVNRSARVRSSNVKLPILKGISVWGN